MTRHCLRAGIDGSRGFGLKAFSDDELYAIHLATLEILAQTGIKVESGRAMDIFEAGGITVDRKKSLVKIPPHVVEDAINSAPSEILLAGRDPRNDIILGDKRVAFTNFGEAVMMIDPFTGERRESTKEDVANIALTCDALSEVDVMWRPCEARDTPPEISSAHEMEAMLANTSKHIAHGCGSGELLKIDVEMGALVAGGKEKLKERPIFSSVLCPSSPLILGRDCCEVIIESAIAGVPCIVLSMAMAGGTAPVTLAGTLIVHNAEVLGGIVLAQLTSKGAPVVYGSSTTCLDLRNANAPVGAPELAVFSAAVVKLAQYYRLCSLIAGG
jgi:trimethylamine--corrinoid protein Co-methyltransferase